MYIVLTTTDYCLANLQGENWIKFRFNYAKVHRMQILCTYSLIVIVRCRKSIKSFNIPQGYITCRSVSQFGGSLTSALWVLKNLLKIPSKWIHTRKDWWHCFCSKESRLKRGLTCLTCVFRFLLNLCDLFSEIWKDQQILCMFYDNANIIQR